MDAAIAVRESALERFPDEATGLYNLACYESLSGKADDALGHLERALDARSVVARAGAEDTDLDPLRYARGLRAPDRHRD